MSKKNKRQTRRTDSSVVVTTPMATASSITRGGGDREFKPDYSYVIKDLRRIGLLAGTFFAILIVLSFFLN